MSETRTETDSFGPIAVPADRYLGAPTQRSLENFRIAASVKRMPLPLIHALVLVKKAAAHVNARLGLVEQRVAGAIGQGGRRGARWQVRRAFPAGRMADGSGTQTNMNVNEVLANRATSCSALVSAPRARSTPMTTSIAANPPTTASRPRCISLPCSNSPDCCCRRCATSKGAGGQGRAFMDLIKIGRTHLQDATPVHARPGILWATPRRYISGIGRIEALARWPLRAGAGRYGCRHRPQHPSRFSPCSSPRKSPP